ncbi:MAG: hypothetical protein LH631_07370 [Alkalinema sp. CAN_BIN05]|nr:hypothetical protein [Alkalinema sp. CAN_BIN05]
MAFPDFKSADQVQKAYQIRYVEKDLMTFTPKSPSEYFVNEFEFNQENFDIFSSEASRCEAVIYPMLREACKSFIRDYSLWSHKSISADSVLMGTPDYVVAKRSEFGKNVLDFPLVFVAEAKQNDFVRGWGQCLAEMVAAQQLNGVASNLAIYSIVTDGEVWQFGRLLGSIFSKNITRVTIDNLS